jgi:hypothetical protein
MYSHCGMAAATPSGFPQGGCFAMQCSITLRSMNCNVSSIFLNLSKSSIYSTLTRP